VFQLINFASMRGNLLTLPSYSVSENNLLVVSFGQLTQRAVAISPGI
jgi:hypothetical protein